MAQSRKELEREQRREFILQAAERIFGRKPFDEATMQDVAAEAQIGMQGLYEQFPSKQDLYEQLLLHRARAFHARAEAALHGVTEPLGRLRALARVYVETFRENPAFLPVFLKERVHFDWGFDSRCSPCLQPIYQTERKRLGGIVDSAVREGLLRPLPAEYLVQLCMDTLHASLYYSHRYAPKEEVDTCVDRALNCLFEGVGAPR